MIVDDSSLKSFETAFRTGVHGCVRDCACGVIYYNPDETAWTWEEGELDRLVANTRARALSWAIETIQFEGVHYVIDCECWKPRAMKIIAWLRSHDEEIAEFFAEEKKRKIAEATRSPVIG